MLNILFAFQGRQLFGFVGHAWLRFWSPSLVFQGQDDATSLCMWPIRLVHPPDATLRRDAGENQDYIGRVFDVVLP